MLALINPDMPEQMIKALIRADAEPVPVPKSSLLPAPVAGHPDMQLFVLGKDIVFSPELPSSFLKKLEKKACLIPGRTVPRREYPEDIPYNIAYTEACAMHRKDRTDPSAASLLEKKNIPLINVRQGYARCSTVSAGRGRIISADRGICRAAESAGCSSLLISEGNVVLPGYRYGFLGGASGSCHGKVFFTGNLRFHPDCDRITEFILDGGLEPVCLGEGPLLDLGSVLFTGE